MSDTFSSRRSRFSFGEALQGIFEAVFADFGVYVLMSLVIYALPSLLLTLPFGPADTRAASAATFGLPLLRGLLVMVAGVVLQGALVRGVVMQLNGRRPTFADGLRAGLSSSPMLIVLGIVMAIGLAIGALLFLVPFFFLLALWAVAAPAVVMERKGVFGALARSGDLTAGSRWAVLGVLLVMWLIMLIFILLSSAMVAEVTVMLGVLPSWPAFLITTVFATAIGSLGAIFISAAPGVIYVHLRRAKEGAAPAQLAAVFD